MENAPEKGEENLEENRTKDKENEENNGSKETQAAKPKKEPLRNLFAFYAFGALIYTVYSVIISGAQDILAGTFIPTAAVLVTNVGPYFLVTMIAPYFIHKVPYVVRIVAIYVFFTAGLFIIVYAKEVYLKLVGICTTSLGAGIGEVSFFTLTAYYEKVTVAAYSAGTGSGFILGPLYYTGMFKALLCLFVSHRGKRLFFEMPEKIMSVLSRVFNLRWNLNIANERSEKVHLPETEAYRLCFCPKLIVYQKPWLEMGACTSYSSIELHFNTVYGRINYVW